MMGAAKARDELFRVVDWLGCRGGVCEVQGFESVSVTRKTPAITRNYVLRADWFKWILFKYVNAQALS